MRTTICVMTALAFLAGSAQLGAASKVGAPPTSACSRDCLWWGD